MLRMIICFACPFILGSYSAAGHAFETDEIFVTGLRPSSIEETPVSITVIDADDLDIRKAPYIADQLRASPGIGVSRAGARGGLTQVRIRGAEANHTLVLLDGIEISDPVTGETDFGLWPSLNISRIEILRGEQSALYGSDAIGGVINVVSDSAPGTAASAETGSNNTLRASGRHFIDLGKLGLSLGTAGFQTDGVDTSGTGGTRDGSESLTFMANSRMELNKNWSATGLLRIAIDEVETDADTDFDGTLEDTDTQTDSRQLTSGVVLSGKWTNISHQIQGSYTRVERDNVSSGNTDDKTTRQRARLSYSPSVTFSSSGYDLVVNGLIDVESEKYERTSANTVFGDANQKQTFDTIGTAIELLLNTDRWAVQASARHDNNDDMFENANTWRAGVAYQLTKTTRLRAGAGQGIKNPTFTELFGFFPANFLKNPDLKPERSSSYEVGLTQSIGPARLSMTWFEAELENEIFTNFNADFTSIALNRNGKSKRKGIETSLEWALKESLLLNAAYTNLSSENEQQETELRVPGTTGSLSLNWLPASNEKMQIGFAADYVGQQKDIFFSFPQRDISLDAYTTVSATASYRMGKHTSLTFRGENIFDTDIEDVTGFQQPGSQFFIGLKVN